MSFECPNPKVKMLDPLLKLVDALVTALGVADDFQQHILYPIGEGIVHGGFGVVFVAVVVPKTHFLPDPDAERIVFIGTRRRGQQFQRALIQNVGAGGVAMHQ